MRRRFPLAVFLVLVFLAGCGGDGRSSAPAPTGEARRAPATDDDAAYEADTTPEARIVFLGDSLSAGFQLPAEEAMPARLEERLEKRGWPVVVTNAGVSGDTTAGGLARVDWVLAGDPDLVVVELGANDGLRGLPPEATESNLRRIVERVQDAGAKVLLLGMRLPPNYGPGYVASFEAVFPRLAEELDVDHVPFFLEGIAGHPELNLPDGIHPNPEGHRRAAENLLPAVEEALAELGFEREPRPGGTGR